MVLMGLQVVVVVAAIIMDLPPDGPSSCPLTSLYAKINDKIETI